MNQEFSRNMQFEELGCDFSFQVNYVELESIQKQNVEQKLQQDYYKYLKMKQNDPENYIITKREKKNDGFQNYEVRGLSIAALLRCLNASIEYSPTIYLKNLQINNIKIPMIFNLITKLCECLDWDEQFCIGSKYMHLMRNVIKMPFTKTKEELDYLIYYEKISQICYKLLSKIMKKMNQKYVFTEKDTILSYEISKTLFTIVQQINYFQFSQIDQQFFLSNQNIFDKNILVSKQNQVSQLIQNWFMPKQQFCKKNYQKRTIQQKMVEFTTLQLVQKETIFCLINILIQDMKSDSEIYQKEKRNVSNMKNKEIKNQKLFFTKKKVSIILEEVKQKQEVKQNNQKKMINNIKELKEIEVKGKDNKEMITEVDQYVQTKSILNIELTKEIIGLIISQCNKHMSYPILAYIAKKYTLSKQPIRLSFLQEILKSAENASFKNQMQTYLVFNVLNQNQEQRVHLSNHMKNERILQIYNVDINDSLCKFEISLELIDARSKIIINPDIQQYVDQNVILNQNNRFCSKQMVLTNLQIKFYNCIPLDQKCKNCKISNMCPVGPQFDFEIKFKYIQKIINFSQIKQKVVILYKMDQDPQFQNENIGEQYNYMTINFQALTESEIFLKQLREIIVQNGQNYLKQKNIKQKKDEIDHLQIFDIEKQIFVSDFYVQNELRKVLLNITGLDFAKNKKKYYLFQQVSLLKTNVIPQKYLDMFIKQKDDKQIQRYFTDIKQNNIQIKQETAQSYLQNSVLLCLLDDYIIILKENWDKWKFVEDQQQRHEFYQKQVLDKLFDLDKKQISNKEYLKQFEPCSQNQMEMIELIFSKRTCLFTPILIHKMKKSSLNISLKVHKDKQSSVELLLNDNQYLQLMFFSDLNRQRFIEDVWLWRSDLNPKLDPEIVTAEVFETEENMFSEILYE